MQQKNEDQSRVIVAQGIAEVLANWAQQVEIANLKAKLTKCRFDALRKAGFDEEKALYLCTRNIEL